MSDHPYPRSRTWPDCEAEIERLRECQQADGWTINQQSKEIERLRDKALRFDLDQAGIERREREAVELVESRAEIERLRDERDRLAYELHRFESCYITLDETLKAKTREDEIERLRETLRHVIDNPWDYDETRVREALGE